MIHDWLLTSPPKQQTLLTLWKWCHTLHKVAHSTTMDVKTTYRYVGVNNTLKKQTVEILMLLVGLSVEIVKSTSSNINLS